MGVLNNNQSLYRFLNSPQTGLCQLLYNKHTFNLDATESKIKKDLLSSAKENIKYCLQNINYLSIEDYNVLKKLKIYEATTKPHGLKIKTNLGKDIYIYIVDTGYSGWTEYKEI